MSASHPTPPPDLSRILRNWGAWSVIAGALALIMVFAQISGVTTEPTPSVGQQIGEIAGDIKRSAWRSFLGLEPEAPKIEPTPIRDAMELAAPVLGVVAIVLALVSGLRRENWRYPVYGAGLGIGAVVFHFVWWMALLFAGVLLLVAVIENIGRIFEGDWGGF